VSGGPLSLPGGVSVVGNADASSVPAATTPLEAQGSTAYAALHGCHVDYAATAPASGCVFGDPAAKRTVVLIGDSHAAQWFPALERMATHERFRLIAWTKSGCPLAPDVHIFLPAIGRDYTECGAWTQSVLRRLAAMPRPSMIIVGRTSTYLPQVLEPDGGHPGTAQAARLWGAGADAAVSRLRKLANRVIVLRDTPHAPFDVPACISWDPSESSSCNFPRGVPSDAAEYAAERAAGVPRFVYADPTPAVCSRTCRVVVHGVITYRDDNHLTAAFAAAHWRQLAQALSPAKAFRQI
jgi:hypothetical protein